MSEASPPPADTSGPAARRGSLAYIIDDESSIRQFISLILQGNGIDTIEFIDGPSFRESTGTPMPELVFLNVNLEAQDAVTSLEALNKSGFTGAVQLMSNRGSAVLETVRQAGEQMRIHMLPVLKKPFETSAVQKIMTQLKLGHGQAPSDIKVNLAEALAQNWVEFWYQPKIDLRRKQLVGAEAFARVCHPDHGVLSPGTFMPGADEANGRWSVHSNPGSTCHGLASTCVWRSTYRSIAWSSCRSARSSAIIGRKRTAGPAW